MFGLEKKKEFNIDGRKIVIIDKLKKPAELIEVAEKEIESYARNDNVAQFFPRLIFILEPVSHTLLHGIDMVRRSEVEKGKDIIHLPLKVLKVQIEKEQKEVC